MELEQRPKQIRKTHKDEAATSSVVRRFMTPTTASKAYTHQNQEGEDAIEWTREQDRNIDTDVRSRPQKGLPEINERFDVVDQTTPSIAQRQMYPNPVHTMTPWHWPFQQTQYDLATCAAGSFDCKTQ